MNLSFLSDERLKRFIALQCIILLVFLSIVFADRFVLESILKVYGFLEIVSMFHFAFFTVLSTVIYAAIGGVYVIAGGAGGWRVGAGLFIEGIILIRLGLEDILYYVLFGEIVPTELPWLNYNPIMVISTIVVSRVGLMGTAILSLMMIAAMWRLLWRRL